MTNQFEYRPEQSKYPEHIYREYEELLSLGSLDTSPLEFVRELKEIKLSDDERYKLEIVGMRILLQDVNKGIGYLSSSSGYNREKELKAAYYIAKCFSKKNNPAQPVIVTIDGFYRFVPGNLSLVGKTLIFNEVATQQSPGRDFALILTDFTGSNIFTQKILEQIPTQDNAGLNIYKITPFGEKLLKFAKKQLPLLMVQEKGDLNAVLKRIIGGGDVQEENAKLLLATGLLLQDCQTWQNLWYESRGKGTPLYIVAPMIFHDAMNRLNLSWGHGAIDYNYRANCSFGAHNEPLFEDKVELRIYSEQGLRAKEFEERIGPLLEI
jgi:hypothetical protein